MAILNTHKNLTSVTEAARLGAEDGDSGAREAIRENAPDYRTPRDVLGGWGEHASEAASILGVPSGDVRRAYEEAYEEAAERVAREWLAEQQAE